MNLQWGKIDNIDSCPYSVTQFPDWLKGDQNHCWAIAVISGEKRHTSQKQINITKSQIHWDSLRRTEKELCCWFFDMRGSNNGFVYSNTPISPGLLCATFQFVCLHWDVMTVPSQMISSKAAVLSMVLFINTLLTVAALPGKTACNMYNLFFLFTDEPLTSHFGTGCSHTPTTVPFSPVLSSLMQRNELYFVDNPNPFLHLNSIVSLYW